MMSRGWEGNAPLFSQCIGPKTYGIKGVIKLIHCGFLKQVHILIVVYVGVFLLFVHVFLLLSMYVYSYCSSMYSYCSSVYSYCCLCILIVVYVRVCLLFIHVFLLLSMYSYCSSMYSYRWLCILIVVHVFLDAANLTEVFPCFFLGCKANARV